jgi:hypothetical protein
LSRCHGFDVGKSVRFGSDGNLSQLSLTDCPTLPEACVWSAVGVAASREIARNIKVIGLA